jgi:hypothetical protein
VGNFGSITTGNEGETAVPFQAVIGIEVAGLNTKRLRQAISEQRPNS